MREGLKGQATSGEPGKHDPHLKPRRKPKADGKKEKEQSSPSPSKGKPDNGSANEKESAGSGKKAGEESENTKGQSPEGSDAEGAGEKGSSEGGEESAPEGESESGGGDDSSEPGADDQATRGTEASESGDTEGEEEEGPDPGEGETSESAGAEGETNEAECADASAEDGESDPTEGDGGGESESESEASAGEGSSLSGEDGDDGGEGDSSGDGDLSGADAGEDGDADGSAGSPSGGQGFESDADNGPIDPVEETAEEHWGAGAGSADVEEDLPVDEILKRLTEAAEVEEPEAMRIEAPTEDEVNDFDYRALAATLSTGLHSGIRLEILECRPQLSLYEHVMAETEDLRDDLERELKPLFSKMNSDYSGGRRSGALDVSRLWRINTLGETHVFAKRHTPYDPAVAVSLLLDNSGSMSSEMTFGKRRISKVDAVRYVAAAFGDVLYRLNVAHAVNGFTDDDVVWYRRLLRFGQNSGRESVVDFKSYCNNRDGYALRVAGAELAARPEPVKILFMLSDGLPASRGGYTGDVGVADTMQARQDLQDLGIHVVSFYFGPGEAQALRQEVAMYGHSNLVIVNDLDTLASDMSGILRGIVSRFRM